MALECENLNNKIGPKINSKTNLIKFNLSEPNLPLNHKLDNYSTQPLNAKIDSKRLINFFDNLSNLEAEYHNISYRALEKTHRIYYANLVKEKREEELRQFKQRQKELEKQRKKEENRQNRLRKKQRQGNVPESQKGLTTLTTLEDIYNIVDPKEIRVNNYNWNLVNEENKLLLREWMLDMRARKITLNTIKQYEGDAKLIFIYMLKCQYNKCVTEMSLRDWKIYTLFLIDTDVSNARVNRMLSTVRNMLAFAEESDLFPEYEHSTAIRLHGIPKEKAREIVFIEDDDFLKLYEYLMEKERYFEATLWALAYESAGRKTELSQVQKAYITDNRNSTNVVVGKRGKKFSLIYFDLTQKATKEWLKVREDNNPMLFVDKNGKTLAPEQLYQTMVKLRKDFTDVTGKELNFNVHSLRHSALENYSTGKHEVCRQKKMKGIPVEKLKLISHHSSIEVCESYLKDKSVSELEKLFNIDVEN